MNTTTLVRAAFGLTAATLLLAPAGARAASQYSYSWSGPLGSGDILDVSDINGSITVTRSGGSDLRVGAIISAQRGDPRAVKVQVTRVGRTVYVCPVYPGDKVGRDCKNSGSNLIDRNDRRVNFSIALPAGAALKASNINGRIDVLRVQSDVDARTVNQDITILTTGTANAKTVNGAISADIGTPSWRGALSFETVNGNLSIRLPKNAAFTLSAKTLNGRIRATGFALPAATGFVGKSMNGTVGRGGGQLNLKTLNGPITLSTR